MNEKTETFHYPKVVIATDDAGNTFAKDVIMRYDPTNTFDKWMIDFGGWANYYATDLFKRWIENNPSKKPFCLDIGGRNHRGSPNVCVSHEDMTAVVDWGKQTIILHGEYEDIKEVGFGGTFEDYLVYCDTYGRDRTQKDTGDEDEGIPF